MCGIVGVFGHPEAAKLSYLGLYALQHRGQESAGIVSAEGPRLTRRGGMGHVADVFSRAEQEYGVPPGVITAFWAMETDFGAVQGDFNTRNALVTLAHDCRRPELFRPQLIALIEMVTPYVPGGAGAGGFDCCGLVYWGYAQAGHP